MTNTTIYKSPRAYLPIVWAHNNVPVNADVVMAAAGLPVGMDQIPVARAGSVTSVVALLSSPVTNGALDLTLRLNGVDTTERIVFDPTDGTALVLMIPPGLVELDVGDTLGIHLESSTPFAPAGSIDVVVYLEVEPV